MSLPQPTWIINGKATLWSKPWQHVWKERCPHMLQQNSIMCHARTSLSQRARANIDADALSSRSPEGIIVRWRELFQCRCRRLEQQVARRHYRQMKRILSTSNIYTLCNLSLYVFNASRSKSAWWWYWKTAACLKQNTTLGPLCILPAAHIIDCALSEEIKSS